ERHGDQGVTGALESSLQERTRGDRISKGDGRVGGERERDRVFGVDGERLLVGFEGALSVAGSVVAQQAELDPSCTAVIAARLGVPGLGLETPQALRERVGALAIETQESLGDGAL